MAWLLFGGLSLACAVGAFETGRGLSIDVESTPDGPAIVGLVIDGQTHQPVQNAVVVLQCDCIDGVFEKSTNATGAFGFRDLAPGTYTVQVLFGTYDRSVVVKVEPGRRTRIRITSSSEPRVIT